MEQKKDLAERHLRPAKRVIFQREYFLFFKISMDDKEYYSLMNRSSSWALQQALKKKTSTKKALSQAQKTELPDNAQTFTSLELRQGRADAEMLLEKKSD